MSLTLICPCRDALFNCCIVYCVFDIYVEDPMTYSQTTQQSISTLTTTLSTGSISLYALATFDAGFGGHFAAYADTPPASPCTDGDHFNVVGKGNLSGVALASVQ